MTVPAKVLEGWREAWPKALEVWSSYTLLREPVVFGSDREARDEGMAGEIAAIRLRDQVIMVNAQQVVERGLEGSALAILAHEIGHHIYVPGNLLDNAKLYAVLANALPNLPADTVHVVANLWADILINDRLQRQASVDMAAVYARLRRDTPSGAGQVWTLYTRSCELLWRVPSGTLCPGKVEGEMDADAQLVARLVRSFAADWLAGARRFAHVLYPYLVHDQEESKSLVLRQVGLGDTRQAGQPAPGEDAGSAIPDGLTDFDPAELGGGDGFDEDLDDPLAGKPAPRSASGTPGKEGEHAPSGGQRRQPYQFGQLLQSLGLDLDAHEVTTRYYRERALPYLIPFPTRRAPESTEPLPEGVATWETGEPLDAIDILESVIVSPQLVPGVTTVQRVYGESPGAEPAPRPLDLDIYVDCSGSMPNPAAQVSYLTLAATILSLSALRAGARVQATLWSSAGVFETTGGFIRDEKRVLGTVTGYVPGGTAFPIHILRDTYEDRKPSEPPAHIVVISDDGVDTMLRRDEKGNDGAAVASMALAKARGGGTLVLNLVRSVVWKPRIQLEELGFRIHAVQAWEDLVAFARAFVVETYGRVER